MAEVAAATKEVLLPDILGVLDALAWEVNKKGRNIRIVRGRTTDESIIVKAHRAAWGIYREGTLRDRFSMGNRQRFKFSSRDMRYDGDASARANIKTGKAGRNVPGTFGKVRKAQLPDYVFSGKFRDQVLKRKPRIRYDAGSVVSRFTIRGGPLNALKKQRGYIKQNVIKTHMTKDRAPHMRNDPRIGRKVSVRGYRQVITQTKYTGVLSAWTYAQEWQFQPWEVNQVNDDTKKLIVEGFRTAIYDKRTKKIRTSVRKRMRAA